MRQTLNTMLAVLCSAMMMVLVVLALRQAAACPVVYQSWSTKRCVRVEPRAAGSCQQLPERYERVWVP